MIFGLETNKTQFLLKKCDIYNVFILSFCHLNREILQKIESRIFFRILEGWFYINNKINIRTSANGGILLQKSNNRS